MLQLHRNLIFFILTFYRYFKFSYLHFQNYQVLCDAVGIPCRFIRYVKNGQVQYYNLVLIPSIPGNIYTY